MSNRKYDADLRSRDVSYDDLRSWADESGVSPRVHGNGFIQVDLWGPGSRLNVWGHPDIPRQRVSTAIHDHRFGFVSTCIRGQIVNFTYEVGERCPAGYDVYEPRPRKGEDTELVRVDGPLRLTAVRGSILSAEGYGGVPRAYAVAPGEVHEADPLGGPAATVMTKTITWDDYRPRVFVPSLLRPDNDLDRNAHDAGDLWRIVREVLEGS